LYKSTHTIKPGIKIISKVLRKGGELKLEGNIIHVKTEIESLVTINLPGIDSKKKLSDD